MAVLRSDLWNADLPPLADVNGVASLEDSHLPPSLRGIAGRIMEAMREGKRIIVLNVTPAYDERDDAKAYEKFASRNADVYQYALRGLAQDPRFGDYLVISPDDRDIDPKKFHDDMYKSFAVYAALSNKVAQLEGQGCGKDGAIPALTGKPPEEIKGLIVVFTPQILSHYNVGHQLKSRIGRLVGLDKTVTIDISPSETPLYEQWNDYSVHAKVEEFRRLLIEAASDPLVVEGVFPKANECGPEFARRLKQESSETTYLRILQRGFYMPGVYVVYGKPGTGKTTLMLAAYQLALQTGYETFVDKWEKGMTSVDNYKGKAPERWLTIRGLVKEGRGGTREGYVNAIRPAGMIFIDRADLGSESSVKEHGRVLMPDAAARVFSTMSVSPKELMKGFPPHSPLKFLLSNSVFKDTVAELGKITGCTTYLSSSWKPVIACELKGEDWSNVITKNR